MRILSGNFKVCELEMLPFIYPTCHQYIGDIMGIHHFSTRILVAVHVDFGSIGFLPNDVLQDCFGTQIIIIIVIIIIIYLMFEFNEGSPYGNQLGKVSILKWSNFGWFGSTAILGNIHMSLPMTISFVILCHFDMKSGILPAVRTTDPTWSHEDSI